MKKILLSLFLMILAVTTILAGCGAGDTADNASPSAPPAGTAAAAAPATAKAGGSPVKLSFIHWRGEDVKTLDAIIKDFQQENPNITVEMQTFPSGDYQSNAQAKLVDGSAGDVFTSFPGAQFEAIAKAGLFADLGKEAFVSNFTPSLIEAGKKNGAQLAVPYQLVYNIPIYNVELFEKHGITPPADWEGFLAAAEKLKNAGITPVAFAGAGVGPGQFMNPMVMNNAPDPEIFTKLEAGTAKLTEEWWVKTLSQFKELNDKGYFQKDSAGTKDEGANALFIQGKAAILASGSYQMAPNKQQNPALKQKLLAPITVSKDKAVFEGIHTTTFMLAVNSKSKHPEEAKKFIEYLSRKEVAGKYANETGQNVTVKDVAYTSEELKTIAEWASKKTRFQPRFTITNGEIQKAVLASIQAVLTNKTPEQAAAEAQAIVDQQLGKK